MAYIAARKWFHTSVFEMKTDLLSQVKMFFFFFKVSSNHFSF